jgi:hypothetical protein
MPWPSKRRAKITRKFSVSGDSGFTSDVARVLAGRGSHQMFGARKKSEFCNRAKVGPLSRLIRGGLDFSSGADLGSKIQPGRGSHWYRAGTGLRGKKTKLHF